MPISSLSLKGNWLPTLQSAAESPYARVWLHALRNCLWSPWSPGELMGISVTFSLWLTPTIKPGYHPVSRRRLYTCLVPCVWLLPLKGWLDPITNGACIHKSHRTVVNNEAVLNRYARVLTQVSPRGSMERELASLSLKWVWLYISQAVSWESVLKSACI